MLPAVAQNARSGPSDPKEHNKHLFEKYIQDLASDGEEEFIFAALKLTKFLAKVEAYYPEAHASILKALKTARATLTRLSGSTDPFACSSPCPEELQRRRRVYSSLTSTVIGFKHLFKTKVDAQSTLDELEMSARLASEETTSRRAVEHLQDPTHQDQASIRKQSSGADKQTTLSIPERHSSRSRSPNMVVPPNSTTNKDVSQGRQSNLLQRTSVDGQSTSSSRQGTPSTSSIKEKKRDLAVDTPSRSGSTNASTPTNTKTKKRPKLNASKKTLLSTISQDDIKWYASKLGVVEGSKAGDAPSAENLMPTGGKRSSEMNQADAQIVQVADTECKASVALGSSTSVEKHSKPDHEKMAIAGHEPKRPHIIDLTSTEDQEPGPQISQEPQVSHGPQLSHESQLSQEPRISQEPQISQKPQISQESQTSQEAQISQEVAGDNSSRAEKDVDSTMDTSTSPVEPEVTDESMDIDKENLNQLPERPVESQNTTESPTNLMAHVNVERARILPATEDNTASLMQAPEIQRSTSSSSSVIGAVSMEISEDSTSSVELAGSSTNIHGQDSVATLDNTATEQYGVQMNGFTRHRRPAIEEADKENRPSSINGHVTSNGSSAIEQQKKSRTPSPSITSVFEPQTVGLVSVNVGQKRGNNIKIEFEVPSGMETLFTLWKTRFAHEYDLTRGSCLSLACYSLDDLADSGVEFKTSENNNNIICTTLLSARPSWPNNGTLRARIGSRYVFLSPPILTTDDNFVDLAPYVDGRNLSIDLEHGADLDNYVFALFAHPPTVAQLRDLQRRRMKDQEWKAALRSLCRPFTKEEINGT